MAPAVRSQQYIGPGPIRRLPQRFMLGEELFRRRMISDRSDESGPLWVNRVDFSPLAEGPFSSP